MADLCTYARWNRAWWIVPAVVLLWLAVAVGTATQTVVPYAVYTFF